MSFLAGVVHDDGAVVDADLRERRGALGIGLAARAQASAISPDQFDWPPAQNVTVIVGRTSVTSAISIRPASSGK